MTRRGGGRRLEGTCVPALLYTATCSGEGSAGRREVPVSTHGGLGGGQGRPQEQRDTQRAVTGPEQRGLAPVKLLSD